MEQTHFLRDYIAQQFHHKFGVWDSISVKNVLNIPIIFSASIHDPWPDDAILFQNNESECYIGISKIHSCSIHRTKFYFQPSNLWCTSILKHWQHELSWKCASCVLSLRCAQMQNSCHRLVTSIILIFRISPIRICSRQNTVFKSWKNGHWWFWSDCGLCWSESMYQGYQGFLYVQL